MNILEKTNIISINALLGIYIYCVIIEILLVISMMKESKRRPSQFVAEVQKT